MSGKNAWLYGILLWFLGGLGIHRFYLNKTMTGILYLFAGGVLGIGLLVDWIILIFGKIQDNKGLDLQGTRSIRIVTLILAIVIILGIIASALLYSNGIYI